MVDCNQDKYVMPLQVVWFVFIFMFVMSPLSKHKIISETVQNHKRQSKQSVSWIVLEHHKMSFTSSDKDRWERERESERGRNKPTMFIVFLNYFAVQSNRQFRISNRFVCNKSLENFSSFFFFWFFLHWIRKLCTEFSSSQNSLFTLRIIP